MSKLVVVCPAFSLLAGVVWAEGEKTPLSGVAERFLPPIPEGKEWRLAWSDEFEGMQIDSSKWEILGDWKRRDGFCICDNLRYAVTVLPGVFLEVITGIHVRIPCS